MVPPGGEAKLTLGFKTGGYGGKTMKKTILVKTDDPNKKKFNLMVKGEVEKVVDIQPTGVFLDGRPGDTLESVITITPSAKYMFRITEMQQNPESGVLAALVPPEKENDPWKVTVKIHSDETGRFFDRLILKTDSPYEPTLKIVVSALFIPGE